MLGDGNVALVNRAEDNGGHGVSAGTVDRNRATGNTRGIVDATTGGGTAGTANAYEANICSANDLGDSSPAGLCR
jgi:hypothetical protein